ncbi:MAG: hypothetical protein ACP5F6_09075 [Microbacter sp.]
MDTNDDLLEFDDDKAIEFIIQYISDSLKSKLTADDVSYFLDIIYDYYESNGYIDENSVEEASIDEEAMMDFIMKAIRKDQIIRLTEDEVQQLLEAEYQYGKSIGIYDEE